jgi:flavodoxin
MGKEILVAYYSWHGNTRKIAQLLERKTGGTLFEIEPTEPYSTDYEAAVAQAKKEIQAGFRPKLKAMPNTSSYTVVFLGTPIWWHTMAPPLAAFIERFDLKRKILVPFYTHGGGGAGTFENDLVKLCPNSAVLEGFGTYNSGGRETPSQIDSWLGSTGLEFEK